jgi:ethanolamine-phosphate cytidylyltransferase
MLTCTRVNPFVSSLDKPHPLAHSFSKGSCEPVDLASGEEEGEAKPSPSSQKAKETTLSRFLPTSRRLVQFSNGKVAPEGARIVYIDGAFDVFHPGHVKVLQAAKREGDFLLVGLHTDEEVQSRRGPHLPIMNLHERSLSVLACKVRSKGGRGAP